MVKLPLTQGYHALIDDADWGLVKDYSWNLMRSKNTNYADARMNGKVILLHRYLMGNPDSQIDHKDHNGLNCQRANLRIATRSQNSVNKQAYSATGLKGIRQTPSETWSARIGWKGKGIHIGAFPTLLQAANAYDKKAFELYGEFAVLNNLGDG